jgi:hypothetical protein
MNTPIQKEVVVRQAATFAACMCAIAPIIYLVFAIQYSAIIYPYFDHLVFVKYLAAHYDGNLHIVDLFAPQAQSRPFIPRLIFLANAVATEWDVRSEFIFLYATIFGTLAVHFYTLRRLCNDFPVLPFMVAAVFISVLICSPVGNTNHWWSLMLLETLASLLITISLVTVALNQSSWPANFAAAVVGWVAAYSLSNGLFVFPAIFAVHQIASGRPFKLRGIGAFWITNFILLCVIYVPGLSLEHRDPTVFELVWFFFVYLGNPLGSLLWFPFTSPFDVPLATKFNGMVGMFLVVSTLLVLRKASIDLQAKRPEAFLLFSFVVFAVISAVVTAWGRAGFGVHGAQSSRYSTFAAYLLVGIIYYFAVRFARSSWAGLPYPLARYSCLLIIGVLLVLSSISYVRAVPIYRIAHNFNQIAASAYGPRDVATDLDKQLYPDSNYFQTAKATLYRLGLGPYRLLPLESATLSSGSFVRAISLTSGMKVVQRFKPLLPRMRSISLPVVDFARVPTKYFINWKVTAVAKRVRQEVTSGTLLSSEFHDWQNVTLQIPVLPGSTLPDEIEVEFSVRRDQVPPLPAGLPLYQSTNSGMSPPVEIDGVGSPDGGVLALQILYERD